jgi:hypothetical protein
MVMAVSVRLWAVRHARLGAGLIILEASIFNSSPAKGNTTLDLRRIAASLRAFGATRLLGRKGSKPSRPPSENDCREVLRILVY